jgi:hypothetical protein
MNTKISSVDVHNISSFELSSNAVHPWVVALYLWVDHHGQGVSKLNDSISKTKAVIVQMVTLRSLANVMTKTRLADPCSLVLYASIQLP